MECSSLESGTAVLGVSNASGQKRPMNAFLIFCKRHRSVVRERYPHLENRSITKILGEWWAALGADQKTSYIELAKQYKEAFMKANPHFKWYKTTDLARQYDVICYCLHPHRPPQSSTPPPPVPNAESQPIVDDSAKPSSPSSGSSMTNENLSDGNPKEANCAPKPLKKRYLENGEFKAFGGQNGTHRQADAASSSSYAPSDSATGQTISSKSGAKSPSASHVAQSERCDSASLPVTAGPPILDLETANRVIENALSGTVQNALQGLNNDFNSELISHRVNSVRELIDATNNQNAPLGPSSSSASTTALAHTKSSLPNPSVNISKRSKTNDLLPVRESDSADSDSCSSSSSEKGEPGFPRASPPISTQKPSTSSGSESESRPKARDSPVVGPSHTIFDKGGLCDPTLENKPGSVAPPYAVVKGPSIFANSNSSILETVASFSRKADKFSVSSSAIDSDPDKPLNLSASKVLTASNQHIIDHFIDKLLTASNTEAGNPMPKELTDLKSKSPPLDYASVEHHSSPFKPHGSATQSASRPVAGIVDESDSNKKSDGGKKSERTCKGKRYAELVRDGKLGKPKANQSHSDSDHEGGKTNCENQSKWVTGGFDLEKHIAELPQLGDAQLLDALTHSKANFVPKSSVSHASGTSEMRDSLWAKGGTSTAQLASDYLHDTIVNEIKRKPTELQKPATICNLPPTSSASSSQVSLLPPVSTAGIITAIEVVERVRVAQAAAAAKASSSKSSSSLSPANLKRPSHHSHPPSLNGDQKRSRFSSDEEDSATSNSVNGGSGNRASSSCPISPTHPGIELKRETGANDSERGGSLAMECDGLAALAEVALLQARNSLTS